VIVPDALLDISNGIQGAFGRSLDNAREAMYAGRNF